MSDHDSPQLSFPLKLKQCVSPCYLSLSLFCHPLLQNLQIVFLNLTLSILVYTEPCFKFYTPVFIYMYLRNFTFHLLAVSTSILLLQFLKFLLTKSFLESFVSSLVYILEKVDQLLLPYRKSDNTSKFNEVCVSNEIFLILQALFSFWKTFFTLLIV